MSKRAPVLERLENRVLMSTSSATEALKNLTIHAPNIPAITASEPRVKLVSARGVDSAGEVTVRVKVRYTDPQGISSGSIDTTDISVSDGLVVTGSAPVLTSHGKTADVTYTITGIDDLSIAVKGKATYHLTAAAGGVSDTKGNVSHGGNLGTFILPVKSHPVIVPPVSTPPTTTPPGTVGGSDPGTNPQPADVPTATPGPAPAVTSSGVSSVQFLVAYHDDSGMDASSIGIGDLQFVNSAALPVLGVSTAASDDGTTVIATYTLGAPNGTAFTFADNGVYHIVLKAGEIANKSGATAAATDSGWTDVSVSITPIPTATAGPSPTVLTTGVSSVPITVTYEDPSGIDLRTISTSNITFLDDSLPVLGVSTVVSNNGRTVVATYTLGAPDGQTFKGTDDTTYRVLIAPNSVFNGVGQAVPPTQSLGFLNVSVVVPPF